MPTNLINFWRRCDLRRAPYAHPDDLQVFLDNEDYVDMENRDVQGFLKSSRFGNLEDNRLHLSLLPTPYWGNLKRADIFVLLLNPGFNPADYHAEINVPEFRKRIVQSITQELDDVEFPFVFLDPNFAWHSGFNWWEKKLRGVAQAIAKAHFNGRYIDGLRALSNRLAGIELLPYHSKTFEAGPLIKKLATPKAALKFVHEELVPAAIAGEKTIIAARQTAVWNLPKADNIVVYGQGLSRGASLSPSTPGGQAILARFGL